MDVATKTFEQVVREFNIAEMELDVDIKEVLNKVQKLATMKEHHQKLLSLDYMEWQKENQGALTRNKDYIKELEFTKAKLRSRYYYQPATNHFDDQVKKFKTYMEKKFTSAETIKPPVEKKKLFIPFY